MNLPKKIMSGSRAFSSPQLLAAEKHQPERSEDCSLEGISTNVKLLLKLIQDHNEASSKDAVDERKVQRVAGMMSIIEDVRARIQKSQNPGGKKKPELRRCNTELVRANIPRSDQKKQPPTSSNSTNNNSDAGANNNEPIMIDEKEKLRKQLSASMAARKSLEMMCTSLGKEKEIMASELSKKVHEISGLEELVSDLKAQNDMLLTKVKACAAEHKEKKDHNSSSGGTQGNSALQERNKALSEQLLKSLDGYRSLKRKLKDSLEENARTSSAIEEMGSEVHVGLQKWGSLKEKIYPGSDDEEISALDAMFESLALKVANHKQKKTEMPKNKSDSKGSKVSVTA